MKTTFFYQYLDNIYIRERYNLLYSLVFTLSIGVLAYGFMFANGFYSHDSLTVIFSFLDNRWQVSLGRFIQPIFRYFFIGTLNTFWYQGFLGLFFLAISSVFIYRLFNLNNKIYLFFISAILTLNISSCLLVSTYIHWFCIFSFAQLLSTIAVYIIFKIKEYWILAILFLFLSIGLYQLYLSIFLVLAIIKLVQIQIDNSELSKTIFLKICIRLFIVTVAGLLLYAISIYLIQKIGSITLPNSYNSVNKAFSLSNKDLNLLMTVYLKPLTFLVNRTPYWNLPLIIFNIILYITSILLIIFNIKGCKKFISLLLILFLPLASNITVFLTGGMIHGLMLSPFFYCFLIFCIFPNFYNIQEYRNNRITNYILKLKSVSLVLFLLLFTFNSIKFSNLLIEKKHLESVQTFVNVNYFINRLNSIPSYQNGKTKVFIVTPEYNIKNNTIFNKRDQQLKVFYQFTGNNSPSAASYEYSIRNYFKYFLNQKINLSKIIPLEKFSYRDRFKDRDQFYLDGNVYIKVD